MDLRMYNQSDVDAKASTGRHGHIGVGTDRNWSSNKDPRWRQNKRSTDNKVRETDI